MELTVKLQVFEGPLDLLLHLLDKNKVNIYDIPIVEITNQYMEYIREMKRQDLNVMSEFLVMAATLIDIKSKMLLPAKETEEEEAEDPRAELVEQLLEYKMYKCISYELKDRQMDAEKVMFKEPTIPDEVAAYEEPVDLEELMADVTLKKLNDIFKSIMRKQEDKIDPVRSKFGKIEKEEVSLSDKMVYLDWLPIRRISSFSRPEAESRRSAFRLLEQISSAKPSLLCAGEKCIGFCSYRSTCTPLPASHRAASQPARPAPRTVTL